MVSLSLATILIPLDTLVEGCKVQIPRKTLSLKGKLESCALIDGVLTHFACPGMMAQIL